MGAGTRSCSLQGDERFTRGKCPVFTWFNQQASSWPFPCSSSPLLTVTSAMGVLNLDSRLLHQIQLLVRQRLAQPNPLFRAYISSNSSQSCISLYRKGMFCFYSICQGSEVQTMYHLKQSHLPVCHLLYIASTPKAPHQCSR